MEVVLRRSWLLASPLGEQVATALSFNPDVIVVDLVELTPERARVEALGRAESAVKIAAASGGEVFAQVDKDNLSKDLEAVVWPGVSGVVIPRLESRRQVRDCHRCLAELESRRGIPANSLQIVASLDTAVGNQRAMELVTASHRVWGVTLGMADLEMGLRPGPDGETHLMPYLMQRVIIIAGAAAVTPLGAWWRPPARSQSAGPEDTYQAAVRGKALGFKGSFCTLGHQVEALNRGFNPGVHTGLSTL